MLDNLGLENSDNLINLQESIALIDRNRKKIRITNETKEIINKIKANKEPLNRSELAINGEILKKKYNLKGEQIREMLNYLLEFVYQYPELNNQFFLRYLVERRSIYESDLSKSN